MDIRFFHGPELPLANLRGSEVQFGTECGEGRGCSEAEISEEKCRCTGEGFCRKGNLLKGSGPFSEPPDSENQFFAALIPFPNLFSLKQCSKRQDKSRPPNTSLNPLRRKDLRGNLALRNSRRHLDTVCKLGVHCKRRGSEKSTFLVTSCFF